MPGNHHDAAARVIIGFVFSGRTQLLPCSVASASAPAAFRAAVSSAIPANASNDLLVLWQGFDVRCSETAVLIVAAASLLGPQGAWNDRPRRTTYPSRTGPARSRRPVGPARAVDGAAVSAPASRLGRHGAGTARRHAGRRVLPARPLQVHESDHDRRPARGCLAVAGAGRLRAGRLLQPRSARQPRPPQRDDDPARVPAPRGRASGSRCRPRRRPPTGLR